MSEKELRQCDHCKQMVHYSDVGPDYKASTQTLLICKSCDDWRDFIETGIAPW